MTTHHRPGSGYPADKAGPLVVAPIDIEWVLDRCSRLSEAMGSVIEGKPEAIHIALTTLLAGGHLLVEDVPGVGKTLLAKALARSIDAPARRIQFTPDLLPSDITGVSIYNQQTQAFEFREGAVFAHIVIGDEINRASPRTQSALLESMEEGQVTVGGATHRLPNPFMVLATQNPIEMEGTYPLPEAQRDRFLARISMGYPGPDSELAMLELHGHSSTLDTLQPVTDPDSVRSMIATVQRVHATPALKQYVVDLARATRTTRTFKLGASPRATLHLLRASRAHAALAGRTYVLPDDVQAVAEPVLAHRLMLGGDALMSHRTAGEVLADLVRTVPIPPAARP